MFFDLGVGLLLATLVGAATSSDASLMILLVGVVGALWPDLDFIVWVVRGRRIDHLTHQHRDLLHRPLALTPPLTALMWVWLGWQAGVLFGIATLAHFVHDTIGHGWGIRWLWPLSSRYYCYRSYGGYPTRLYAWTKQEQDGLCDRFGNRQWMKNAYGGLTPVMLFEFCVLALGVAAAVYWYVGA